MDKALAETEKTVNEQENLHSSLSPYDIGPDVEDYEYKNLGVPSPKYNDYRDKKRFRLLNLMSGFLDNPSKYNRKYTCTKGLNLGRQVRGTAFGRL